MLHDIAEARGNPLEELGGEYVRSGEYVGSPNLSYGPVLAQASDTAPTVDSHTTAEGGIRSPVEQQQGGGSGGAAVAAEQGFERPGTKTVAVHQDHGIRRRQQISHGCQRSQRSLDRILAGIHQRQAEIGPAEMTLDRVAEMMQVEHGGLAAGGV